MRKTKRILSVVLSIAMVLSMFTFVMPTSVSAASPATGISNSYDGSKALSLGNADKYPATNTANHGGIGGKAESDVSCYIEVPSGTTYGGGGCLMMPYAWAPKIDEITNNRALIAYDVFFTSSDALLSYEYQCITSEDAAASTSLGNFVRIGPAVGIERGRKNVAVPDNAPTSLSLNEWHNIAVEVACGGTSEVNVYIDGVKYECTLQDSSSAEVSSYGSYRYRINVQSGSFYIDNYYCYDDVYAQDMYGEASFAMTDITVADSDKVTYDEDEKQFTIVDSTLTVAELKELITSDYKDNLTVYADATYAEVLDDTDTVTMTSMVVVSNGDKSYRYYDFYRENTSIFTISVNDATTCTVTGFKEDSIPEAGADLVIPETIAGYTVTAVANNAFVVGDGYAGVKLSSITLPDTIKTIGTSAFCDTYASLSAWPSALETIGAYAFSHGQGLPGTMPAGLKSIGERAFQYASLSSELVLNSGLTTIGKSAFLWTSKVINLRIPDSVTSVGKEAFALTHGSLSSIRFPRNDTFTEIPEGVISAATYYNNSSAADKLFKNVSIYIPETIETIPDTLLRDFKEGATVKIYGAYDSAAYDYYKTVLAGLEAGTYVNSVDGGKIGTLTFIEYDFENDTALVIDETDINTGTADGITVIQGSASTTATLSSAEGSGGKLAEDTVSYLSVGKGDSGANFINSSGTDATYYFEASVMAPDKSFIGAEMGYFNTSDKKDDPDGDNIKDGYTQINVFKLYPDSLSVAGTTLDMTVKAGRWYTFAVVIPNDGSSTMLVYVNGTKHEVTLAKGSYGVRHMRLYGSNSDEENPLDVKFDNYRTYTATKLTYNIKSDVPATLTAKSDAIAVYDEGIVYADETATYTVSELLALLETNESAKANIRVYSDYTLTTQLGDDEEVTNSSVVVVAATNGYSMERTYSYYPVNPPINTTIYDISVIDEEAKTAKVTGFLEKNLKDTDDLSSIGIPSEILGYTITEIGNDAFYGNTEILSVVIPDTVTKIGSGAFGNINANNTAYGNITSVKLSKNLKEIGDNAFKCNANLTGVEFPDGLEKIGSQAFYWTKLKEISLPDSVTYVGGAAFRLCGSATYIKLSAGVTNYTNQFYANGLKLTDIVIPATVTSIGDLAFTDLTTYTMNPRVHGVAGTYAEEYAEANGWEFVNVVANTIVSAAGIYGDGSKELAGTDYDIKYGYKTLDFATKLINIGEEDVDAKLTIALYDENGKMLKRNSKVFTVEAGSNTVVDTESGVSIEIDEIKDGYTAKAFIWRDGNNEPISPPISFTFDGDKQEIHVLAIANSFCNDSFGFINSIAEADGVVIKAQNMYIGGAHITQHYANMYFNYANYQPVINTVYGDTKITMEEALLSDKWDVVALQAATHGRNSNDFAFIDYETWADDEKGTKTGVPNVTTAEIYEFINAYVDELAPGAKHIMHMSWGPCESESKTLYNGRYADAEDPRAARFEAQKAAYEYASTIYADGYNMMVPTSYAVQYALEELNYQEHSGEVTGEKYENPIAGEKSIYRDETCHLTSSNPPYGRVLAGLTWYEYLTGNDVRNNPYQHSSISAEDMAALKKAAHWANEQVVPITGTAN